MKAVLKRYTSVFFLTQDPPDRAHASWYVGHFRHHGGVVLCEILYCQSIKIKIDKGN